VLAERAADPAQDGLVEGLVGRDWLGLLAGLLVVEEESVELLLPLDQAPAELAAFLFCGLRGELPLRRELPVDAA